jgi:hypothetical protein
VHRQSETSLYIPNIVHIQYVVDLVKGYIRGTSLYVLTGEDVMNDGMLISGAASKNARLWLLHSMPLCIVLGDVVESFLILVRVIPVTRESPTELYDSRLSPRAENV